MIKYCISDFKTIIMNDHFVSDLKKHMKSNGIIFIPSDPSDFISIRKYSSEIIKEFMNCGIVFNKIWYVTDIDELNKIRNSKYECDLIFLMGGRTKIQNSFLQTLNLKAFLTEYGGVVLGQSAGALNMCNIVYLSPTHGENDKIEFLKGIGAINEIVEVHFDMFDNVQKSFLSEYDKTVLCITDNAAVKFVDDKICCFGDVYSYCNRSFVKL